MNTLFGDPDIPDLPTRSGPLCSTWVEPPMSTLDRRTRRWQDRAAAWHALGIDSADGRPTDLLGGLNQGLVHIESRAGGTSVFCPVVAELVYRWYTRPGDVILDPFAGGSVRGLVASLLGRHYVGIDLRPEQVKANERQAGQVLSGEPRPQWIVGDADDIPSLVPDVQPDLIFTCPPYHDLEVYSDDPADLSTMPWPDFLTAYRRIIHHAATALRPGRLMAIVVSDVRDRHGVYRGLPWATIDAMSRAGLALYQDAAILDPYGSKQIMANRAFRAGRKLQRVHQYLLVGVKGAAQDATERLRTTHPSEAVRPLLERPLDKRTADEAAHED